MENYISTDQYLHWLCQVITRAGKSFVSEKSDDSHTNLYFDPLGERIVGRWIETEKGNIMLTLNFSELQFEWMNSDYQVIALFPTIGKMITEVEQDIENKLSDLGLARGGFSDKLHFEIPDYPFKTDPIQSVPDQYMKEWKDIRNLANKACSLLLGYLQIEGEIRIWPHHFDTGIYVVTNKNMGIGFGLAMSDVMVDGPYFYMTGNHPSEDLKYKNLPEFSSGSWLRGENWNGAVLPLSELNDLQGEEYKALIFDYLMKAVNWFLNQG
jgi:hypothetical protein